MIQTHLNRFLIEIKLIILGIAWFIALELLIRTTQLNRSLIAFESVFLILFFSYLLTILILHRSRPSNYRYLFPILLIFTILFQIRILFTEISLSDDVYRFFLEGKALTYGINPYITPIEQYPPDLFPNYLDMANNPNITSPYPPLALLLFAGLYLVSPTLLIYRICFSLGFLGSVTVCYKLLSIENKWKLFIFAWNPLLHLEVANGSHFDSLIVLLVMLAIWGLNSKRRATAGGAFLLASLLKYYPVFLVMIYWKALGKRGLSVFLSGMTIYGIYILVVPQALLGVLTYAESWVFNASIFWVFVQIISNEFHVRLLLAGIFLVALIYLAIRSDRSLNSRSSPALTILGLFLLIQPVFHPWYVFWIFPFVLLTKKMNFSWILLTGLLIFSYHIYIVFDTSQIWLESTQIRFIEYLPFYSVLAIEHRNTLAQWYQIGVDRLRFVLGD